MINPNDLDAVLGDLEGGMDARVAPWRAANPGNVARREAVFARTPKSLAKINRIWKQPNGAFKIDYKTALGFESVFVDEPNHISNWTASCLTMVAGIDQVKVIDAAIRSNEGYWGQFKRDQPSELNRTAFDRFRLYTSIISYDLIDQPLEFLDLLSQLGPFIIACENCQNVQNSMLVTGFYYNPNDTNRNTSTQIYYFDPNIYEGRKIGWKSTTLADFIVIMQRFGFDKPGSKIIIATNL